MVLVILLLLLILTYITVNNHNNNNNDHNLPNYIKCTSSTDQCGSGSPSSVVIQKGCGSNVTFLGLQPTDKNQVLITNCNGTITWVNQCSFAGLNNVVTSIKSNGVIVNTNSTNGCLKTLSPTNNNQILYIDELGNLSWLNISDLLSNTGTVSNILTVDGITGGPITTKGIIGLDGWEIVTGSKIFRPKTGIVGKLGDPTHVITDANLITLFLYNSTITHSITTRATTNYNWSTPISNPSIFSLLACSINGELNYFQASSSGQVLVSTGGGVPIWINQCDFAGLSTIVSSLNANPGGSGVVLNNGHISDCLRTLISPGQNRVLVTDSGNNIMWIPQTSLIPTGVSQINTTDGITGGPITTTGTLGLDGWQIDPISKALRPKTSNIGTLGDSTHIVSDGYIVTLRLNNGANFNNITTRATTNYNWSTPTGNPTTTSLITCDTSGNLNYSSPPPGGNQVLTTNGAGNLTWVQQCAFAGLNNTTTSMPATPVGSGVVLNTGTASNCLQTLTSPGINQVLVTDGTNNIKWIPQSSIGGGGGGSGTVTQINTTDGITGGPITTTGTLGLDGWQIDPISKALRPKTSNIGTLGDSTHIVSDGYIVTLRLNNGANFNNITTRATTNYNWSTPTGNPTAISLITCDTSGNLNYSSPPPGGNQVLTTNGAGNITWVQQCAFAGLDNTTTSMPAAPVGSGVVLNTGAASNCLQTLTSPGINQVLVTDGTNNIKWVSQTSISGSGQFFEATYNPLVSTGFVGTGDQIIIYDTIVQNNLPELTYNALTGVFVFSVSGWYKISANQNLAITSIGNQGNTYCKMSLINGTNTSGTEISMGPVSFGNNKTAGGRFADKSANIDRIVNVTAGQSYIFAIHVVSDDTGAIIEFSPAVLAPLSPYPVIAGTINISRA